MTSHWDGEDWDQDDSNVRHQNHDDGRGQSSSYRRGHHREDFSRSSQAGPSRDVRRGENCNISNERGRNSRDDCYQGNRSSRNWRLGESANSTGSRHHSHSSRRHSQSSHLHSESFRGQPESFTGQSGSSRGQFESSRGQFESSRRQVETSRGQFESSRGHSESSQRHPERRSVHSRERDDRDKGESVTGRPGNYRSSHNSHRHQTDSPDRNSVGREDDSSRNSSIGRSPFVRMDEEMNNCEAPNERNAEPAVVVESIPGTSGIKRRHPSSSNSSDSPTLSIRINPSIFETSSRQNDKEEVEENEREAIQENEREEVQENVIAEDVKPMRPSEIVFPSDSPAEDISESQRSLLNIFSNGPLPKIPSVQRTKIEEPPPAKIPRAAYPEEEESSNVPENNQEPNEPVPNAPMKDETDDDTDSENEVCNPAPWIKNEAQELAVFTQYDFTRRPFRPNDLAVISKKDEIIDVIENNRVVIIEGYTGCGKTTQIPQFLIDQAYKLKRPCKVIVTQPRKLAATSVATRVCDERGWQLGTVVGFHVGLEKKQSPHSLVTYMTTGVLLQKLTKLKELSTHCSHIIIDEVHERDLHTDLLLLFLKKILMNDRHTGREKNVKIILMSATLNHRKLSEYFTLNGCLPPVVRIQSDAQRYKIDEFYLDNIVSEQKDLEEFCQSLEKDSPTISDNTYIQAKRVIVSLDDLEIPTDPRYQRRETSASITVRHRGSVLVFLPGFQEIKTLERILKAEDEKKRRECTDGDYYKWDIHPLHSSISFDDQRQVFKAPVEFRRKIILSTNVAESSITVPDIAYVIDFCLTKSNSVDDRTNFSCLKTYWASVSQCIQRKGRTGRTRDGQVFRLIPRSFFRKLEQDTVPDMLKASLESVVLQIKTFDLGTPFALLALALDRPDTSRIEPAVQTLKEVGALTVKTTVNNKQVFDKMDGDLTFLGQIMALLPISFQCARLVMFGYCFGVLKETIIIAAGLNGKSPFIVPYKEEQKLDTYMHKLTVWSKDSFSDCFAILRAYKTWAHKFDDTLDRERRGGEHQWGSTMSIRINQMKEMKSTVEEIESRLNQNGIKEKFVFPSDDPDNNEPAHMPRQVGLMLKVAIAGAFYPLYFKTEQPLEDYGQEREKDANGNDLYRTVILKDFPLYNNGPLYAKSISNALSHGQAIPLVKFDRTKVFVVFDEIDKKVGPFAEGVYRAVKRRQLQMRVGINYIPLEAESEYLRGANETRGDRQRKYLRSPPLVQLPGVDQNRMRAMIQYVISPSLFWIVKEEDLEEQTDIQRAINNPEDRNLMQYRRRLYVGALVLAPFQSDDGNQELYRAVVKTIYPGVGQCQVYFIDYGNTEYVPMKQLYEFSPNLQLEGYHVKPRLAIQCRLSETKAPAVYNSVWPDQAKKGLELGMSGVVDLNVYAVVDSVVCCEVFLQEEDGSYSFNEWLKKKSLGDHTRESARAIRNHTERVRVSKMRNDDVANGRLEAINRNQIGEEFDKDFYEPPVSKELSNPVTLKGPHSPVEVTFQPLCKASSCKSVGIDSSSVNSVVLDCDPMCSTSKMMIAAVTNIQSDKGKMICRETTLMPSIPGILPLMALMFAPKAELRCDEDMAMYTGVLCGLGQEYNDREKLLEPVYGFHDMEIVFPVKIVDEDIKEINTIRHSMNKLLRQGLTINARTTIEKLCERIFKLLRKPREPMKEEIWPQESYEWGKIQTDRIKAPSMTEFPVYPSDIFQPHSTVHLEKPQPVDLSWDLGF